MSEQQPTVNDGFTIFAKSTDLTFEENLTVRRCQAVIENYLAQHYEKFSTELTGSFSRKTMISPLHDATIDMIVLFQEHLTRQRLPSLIFRELSKHLKKEFPDAEQIKDSLAIIVPIENFNFKIQPGYSTDTHVYMLPAGMFNEWIKYDAHSYKEYFVQQNVRHKGELAAIIRMIKTWNKVSNNYFDHYYLELLATTLFCQCEYMSFSESICYFFKSALKEVVFQKQDPANKEFSIEGLNDIDSLISAMLLLKNSYQIAEEALMYEQNEQMEKAINNWNKLFPNVFPTHTDMVVGKIRNQRIKGADALRMMLDHKQK